MQESTKRTLEKLVAQIIVILIGLMFERTREQETIMIKPLRNLSLHMDANQPSRLLAEKNKKRSISFMDFALALPLISIMISICMFTQPASAAGYHAAHTMKAAVAHGAYTTANTTKSKSIGSFFKGLGHKIKQAFDGIKDAFTGIACTLGQVIVGKQVCSPQENYTPWSFPCVTDAGTLSQDWLSGDPPSGGASAGNTGHFFAQDINILDYFGDNTNKPQLFSVMQGVGFVLLFPVIILIGYQLLWASWTFRYSNVLSVLPQLLLGIALILASPDLIALILTIETKLNVGLMALHTEFPFPQIQINGVSVPWTLDGDSSNSLRGIVMPIGEWGCQANDFIGVLENKFVTDILGLALPFIGGLVQLAGTIRDGVELLHMLGGLIECVLSIGIFAQVLFRIILLNYYILLCPVVFACWALPGGVGQAVVSQWFKGFFSIVFVQTAQVFVAVTLPLMLPAFPQLPWDGTGVLKSIMIQLPPIIVLLAVSKVPKLMGTKATTAMSQAGTVAGGAVVALAGAAWQIV